MFWASSGTLLTTFGVVPLQAGIFTNEKVVKTSSQSFLVSQQFNPASAQRAASVVSYAQSGYGIIQLNETIPAYMAPDYAIKPFALKEDAASETEGFWTANTTLYKMDLQCRPIYPEVRIEAYGSGGSILPVSYMNMSDDCQFVLQDWNNDTIGDWILEPSLRSTPRVRYKTFSSFFVTYFSARTTETVASLSWPCFAGLNGTFLSMFVRNRSRPEDSPNNVTIIACKPHYYMQEVEATVDANSRRPNQIIPLGPEQPVPADMFNTTVFEETISAGGRLDLMDRIDDIPNTDMPRYLESVRDRDLTPVETWGLDRDLHPITAMALTYSNRSTEEFLDHQTFGEAYQAAYRLLFARAMADMLLTNFTLTNDVTGTRLERFEAVTMQPAFTYAVEILLGLASVSMVALLFYAVFRPSDRKLSDDPGMFQPSTSICADISGSTASVMSMTADNVPLLFRFKSLGHYSKHLQREKLQPWKYAVGEAERQYE